MRLTHLWNSTRPRHGAAPRRVGRRPPRCAPTITIGRVRHTLIESIGFGFEHYDHLGRWRDTENGLPIDATGSLTWVPGDPAAERPFDGAVEFADRLAASPHVASCVAEHWDRFAMGRGTSAPEDGCNISQVLETFVLAGGDVTEFLVAIVRSDAFRYRPGEPLIPPEPVDETDLYVNLYASRIEPPAFDSPGATKARSGRTVRSTTVSAIFPGSPAVTTAPTERTVRSTTVSGIFPGQRDLSGPGR